MIRLGELKKILKEEIKFRLKNGLISEGKLLTEQDDYTFYEIRPVVSGKKIKVAVKGDVIYSVVANPETGEFEVGKPIGGGNVEDLKQNISNGISGQYLEGRKYVDSFVGGKVQAVTNYFSTRPEIAPDYGFVFDDKGMPSLVAFPKDGGDPLFAVTIPMGKGSIMPLPTEKKISKIPTSSSTTNMPNVAELNADFKFDSDDLNNDGEFTQQLTDYLNEFAKPEFQYLKKYEPLPLMVATSASIDSTNAKYDYELTVDRVNAISRKIGEISRSNPKIPKFQIKPMPLGQTDRFAKGVKAPKYNSSQTAVNRKVIVGPVKKVEGFLAKYPGEINKG